MRVIVTDDEGQVLDSEEVTRAALAYELAHARGVDTLAILGRAGGPVAAYLAEHGTDDDDEEE